MSVEMEEIVNSTGPQPSSIQEPMLYVDTRASTGSIYSSTGTWPIETTEAHELNAGEESKFEAMFSRLLDAVEKIADKKSTDPRSMSVECSFSVSALEERLSKLELAFDGVETKSDKPSLSHVLFQTVTEAHTGLEQRLQEWFAKIDAQLERTLQKQSAPATLASLRNMNHDGNSNPSGSMTTTKVSDGHGQTPGLNFRNRTRESISIPGSSMFMKSGSEERGSGSDRLGRGSQRGPRLSTTNEDGTQMSLTLPSPKKSWGDFGLASRGLGRSSKKKRDSAIAIGPFSGPAPISAVVKYDSSGSDDTFEASSRITFGEGDNGDSLEDAQPPTNSRAVKMRGSLMHKLTIQDPTKSSSASGGVSQGMGMSHMPTYSQAFDLSGRVERMKKVRLLPLHPDSAVRVILDVCCMLVLLYDSIMIPFLLAWNPKYEEGSWLHVLSWVTLAFWTSDMFLGFVTGFYQNDQLVMNIPQIALHYCKTWWFIDVCVVASDWVSLLLEDGEENQKVMRIMRICKLNRLLRLAVMLKKSRFANLQERSETFLMRFNLTDQAKYLAEFSKILVLILWLNHLGCCVWYVVGTDPSPRSEGDDWRAQLGLGDDADMSYEYLMGYYWSITSMIALEPGRLEPQKSIEIMFLMVFLLFSFFFASAVVSSLAAMLLDFKMQRQDQKNKMRMLRRFLIENKVETTLALTLQSQIMERMNSRNRITEKDVTVLALLSTSMRSQLRHNLYAPHLSTQHFFFVCDFFVGSFVRDLCFYAMHLLWPVPGEECFAAEGNAESAYYVLTGHLQYVHAGSLGKKQNRLSIMASSDDQEGLVEPRQWLCELALWMHWKHQGWLEALTDCELLAIGAEGLEDVIGRYPELKRFAHHYGTSLIKAMREQPPANLSDLTSSVDHANIVMNMPQRSRIMMSMPVVETVKRQSNTLFGRKSVDKLEDEVKLGKCDLIYDQKGRALRIVSVATLNLMYKDKILVQLWEHGDAQASYALPGTKLQVGEMPTNAVQRVVKRKLNPWSDGVHIIKHEVTNEEKPSPSYGVETRYVLTKFFARIVEDFTPIQQKVTMDEAGELLCERPARIGGMPVTLGHEAQAALEQVLSKGSNGIAVTESVTGNEVFCMSLNGDPDKFIVCTWMSPDEFEHLSNNN